MSPEVTLGEEKQLARKTSDILVKQVALLEKVLDGSHKPKRWLVDISTGMSEGLNKYLTWQDSEHENSQNEDTLEQNQVQPIEKVEMNTQVCEQDLEFKMG
ncbi:hypothetical protein JTB14_001256 [Gonioctena quinquepunctata]|nr:hypothetical protein JTB14_001256 [Gonioctena quinquepunctata]